MSNKINHPPPLNRTVSSANHIVPDPDNNGVIVDRTPLVPRSINRVVSSANGIIANPENNGILIFDRPELYNIKYIKGKNGKNGIKGKNGITGKNGKTKGGRRTRARKHKIYYRRRTCKK